MKKTLGWILCAMMILGVFTGCSPSNDKPSDSVPESQPAETQAPENSEPGSDEVVFDTPVELKWAIASSANSGPTEADAMAMDLIKERSNGMITFKYYSDGALGNSPDLLEQVLDGSLDIIGCGIAEVGAYTTILDILDLPFLVGDNEATVVFSDEWAALVKQANAELGADIVATMGFGSRDFITTQKPIRSMSDLSGMNIRAVSTDLIASAMTLMNANPVNVAFTELYTALSSNMVDGIENNITTMNAMGLLDTVKYCTRVNFYPYVAMDVMRADLKDSLPEGYYELILECIQEANRWWEEEGCAAWEQKSLDAAVAAGVEIIELDDAAMQEIRDAMAPLYDEYTAKSDTYAAFIAYCQGL